VINYKLCEIVCDGCPNYMPMRYNSTTLYCCLLVCRPQFFFSINCAEAHRRRNKIGPRYIIHCVSKNDTTLACYNFDVHQSILIIFGMNVSKKVSSQVILYFSTSPNWCFCTTWGNRKTENSAFSLKCCMLF